MKWIMGNPIKNFQDLDVYQNLYQAMLRVMREVIPCLPKEERFDLCDQMRRACKAAPALLAEGFAKRHHQKQWKKYLQDAMGEFYEMVNHLSICRDVYPVNVNVAICDEIIDINDHSCRQLTKLAKVWQSFHE